MGIKKKSIVNSIYRNRPYFEDFITRSVYNSNAIEGNTLSYYETYALIFNDNAIIKAKPREIYEAINLKYAFDYTLRNLDKDLSLDMIKKIGIFINKNIEEINGFRTTPVMIIGASHIPPNANDVPRLLSELVYKVKKSEFNNIYEYMAYWHIRFERIHPFTDGNGRTGRVILSRMALRNGLAPVIIPVDYRANYMNMLDKCDVKSLAELLKELNKVEIERMNNFGIKV